MKTKQICLMTSSDLSSLNKKMELGNPVFMRVSELLLCGLSTD